MVYNFVDRSGGHMKVYTERGVGTTFRIYLPRGRDDTTAAESAPPGPAETPRGTETILIVEDEKLLRDVAVSILADLGYETVAAGDGKAALAVLQGRHDIGLFFCDIIMPGGLDGYQAALAAHEMPPGLKILLTSGFTRKREEHSNGEGGYLGSLTRELLNKPYNYAELAVAVRRALDGGGG